MNTTLPLVYSKMRMRILLYLTGKVLTLNRVYRLIFVAPIKQGSPRPHIDLCRAF